MSFPDPAESADPADPSHQPPFVPAATDFDPAITDAPVPAAPRVAPSAVPLAALDADEQTASALRRICTLLRLHTGHDFSLYKRNTILRRIERRVQAHQLPSLDAYISYLRATPAELNVLFQELLIGVTRFFRDPEAFEALQRHLQDLVLAKPAGSTLRVWTSGCSTGEEAYSLAIILRECLDAVAPERQPRLQIFASDISPDALDVARAGFYPATIAADVSAARLTRFFESVPGGYQIRKPVRDLIVFSQHDINKDAPFIRLDLLCCRNLLIYFSAELQRALVPVFHYALLPGGLLLLGPSENLTGFPDLFAPLDLKWKLARRTTVPLPLTNLVGFPFVTARQAAPIAKPTLPAASSPRPVNRPLPLFRPDGNSFIAHVQRALLQVSTPPAVVISPAARSTTSTDAPAATSSRPPARADQTCSRWPARRCATS